MSYGGMTGLQVIVHIIDIPVSPLEFKVKECLSPNE